MTALGVSLFEDIGCVGGTLKGEEGNQGKRLVRTVVGGTYTDPCNKISDLPKGYISEKKRRKKERYEKGDVNLVNIQGGRQRVYRPRYQFNGQDDEVLQSELKKKGRKGKKGGV